MALNAATHNPTGESTAPVSGNPPQAPLETRAAVKSAENQDPLGQHAGGQDGGDPAGEKKVKSEKELEKERKKLEKAKKFAEKKAKTAAAPPTAETSKGKEKKVKQQTAEKELRPEDYVEETPPGEKKILKPLDDEWHKAYLPRVVESGWYDWWEKQGFFKPEFTPEGKVKKEGYFSIPIPPPNVTGALHMGHALTNALQDTMIRFNRMHGKTTLWLPGCDHAGISTQVVVENMLWRKERKTRHDLGREKFIETVWEWKDEFHNKINKVQKSMGGSYDWSREAFTMDENLSAAVVETFVRLHEEGTIYRANRLVHWCTKLNTALSNLELNNKELTGRTLLDVPGYDRKVEFGVITYFKYPIDGTTDQFIEVATTRPETMLGDTGIAVNPKDGRYTHLIGKNAKHPFLDRLLPIFADEYVDMEFGTGAVKMTPAHDANDFALGKKHNLKFINILTDDGKLNHNCGEFEGVKRFDARYTVTQKLKDLGLYVKSADNPMVVPLCEKSKDVIEPLMKPQWYMKMTDMAKAAYDAVKDGHIKVRPKTAEDNYYRWMSNVNDWCLSRQLWWGHQAPAYFVHIDGEPADDSDGERWVSGRTEVEAEEKAAKKFPGKKFHLTRDPDVLDTWFSSGLWPFSTLGWPKKTHDLETLYPQSMLETGWDILFFWIARMIMLGIKLTGQIPFKEIYCHSLIRDSEGRKMSKSLGNVIDPLDVMYGIELQKLHDKLKTGNLDPKEVAAATKFQKHAFPDGIPACGADALRFSLVAYTTGGGDIAFDIKVMAGYRRFCNKVYQATKFVLGKLEDGFVPQQTNAKTGKESLAERWILHKLTIAARDINIAIETRQFSESTSIAYQYFLTQLCDVFIENSKTLITEGTPEEQVSAKNTLYAALEGGLTMLHPFMPFLTEELWQRLPRRPQDKTPSIVVAQYPVYQESFNDPPSEEAYELVLGVARGIRSLMGEYSIKDNGVVYVQLNDAKSHETCSRELASINSLRGKGVTSVTLLAPSDAKPPGCVPFTVSQAATVFLHIKGQVDIDQEIEKAKKKIEKANDSVMKQRKILGDEGYKSKVSEELQEVERKKLGDAEAELREMEASLQSFEKLKLED